jgi:hypothetical protein
MLGSTTVAMRADVLEWGCTSQDGPALRGGLSRQRRIRSDFAAKILAEEFVITAN